MSSTSTWVILCCKNVKDISEKLEFGLKIDSDCTFETFKSMVSAAAGVNCFVLNFSNNNGNESMVDQESLNNMLNYAHESDGTVNVTLTAIESSTNYKSDKETENENSDDSFSLDNQQDDSYQQDDYDEGYDNSLRFKSAKKNFIYHMKQLSSVVFENLKCSGCEKGIYYKMYKCEECCSFQLCSLCIRDQRSASIKNPDHCNSHSFMVAIGTSKSEYDPENSNQVEDELDAKNNTFNMKLLNEVVTHSHKQLLSQLEIEFIYKMYNEQFAKLHKNIKCNNCKNKSIVGTRYKCSVCMYYNLCKKCFKQLTDYHTHKFYLVSASGTSGGFGYAETCLSEEDLIIVQHNEDTPVMKTSVQALHVKLIDENAEKFEKIKLDNIAKADAEKRQKEEEEKNKHKEYVINQQFIAAEMERLKEFDREAAEKKKMIEQRKNIGCQTCSLITMFRNPMKLSKARQTGDLNEVKERTRNRDDSSSEYKRMSLKIASDSSDNESSDEMLQNIRMCFKKAKLSGKNEAGGSGEAPGGSGEMYMEVED